MRDRPRGGRRRSRLLTEVLHQVSDVDLFGDLYGVVHLNAEIANRALNFGMAE